jgi:hypothetical protein
MQETVCSTSLSINDLSDLMIAQLLILLFIMDAILNVQFLPFAMLNLSLSMALTACAPIQTPNC